MYNTYSYVQVNSLYMYMKSKNSNVSYLNVIPLNLQVELQVHILYIHINMRTTIHKGLKQFVTFQEINLNWKPCRRPTRSTTIQSNVIL